MKRIDDAMKRLRFMRSENSMRVLGGAFNVRGPLRALQLLLYMINFCRAFSSSNHSATVWNWPSPWPFSRTRSMKSLMTGAMPKRELPSSTTTPAATLVGFMCWSLLQPCSVDRADLVELARSMCCAEREASVIEEAITGKSVWGALASVGSFNIPLTIL
mgnify:CR=1 FL=1